MGGITVSSWAESTATDNSGSVSLSSRSHAPGSVFSTGSTQVTCVFTDPASGNSVVYTVLCGCYMKVKISLDSKGHNQTFKMRELRGALNFFQVTGCAAWISEVWGLRTTICLWKGGLVNWKFPNLGLVNWKFPNLGACKLKISKFGGKLRPLLRLKFSNFLKRGSCELTLLLEMGPLRTAGEVWKGGLQGRTSLYPLCRSVPPLGLWWDSNFSDVLIGAWFGGFP